ncbi:DUF2065 domain-containing protein [Salinarimonas ramus]|uniref:Membrane protein n=1 Tax=Salinarimonas ramus TaxID=690164 RepID=A0A917QEB6_9HYPH|nr:DUF2065 domain-containing protein [Salinarimonas ramus]GGK46498.1 membrane protein [Salinarimonas ramus]
MSDFVVALGLVLAVEGLLFAAFPDWVKRAMVSAAQTPSERMRLVGIVSAIAGVAVVWLIRG